MTAKQTIPVRKKFAVPDVLKDHWMTLADACDSLGLSRWTIAELCAKGVLVRQEYGKFILISRKSVDAYLRAFISPSR